MAMMKGLVLHNTHAEPWLDKIESGEKKLETRYWPTNYRGDIVLVQSRSTKRENDGKAVMVATISDCRLMQPEDIIPSGGLPFDADRWCWVLTNVRKIKEPFTVPGFQRIFNVEVPDHMDLIPI